MGFFSPFFTLSELSLLCLSATQVLGPHHPAAEDPLSFRLLQTFSFANHSWEYTQVSGWLGELQTHGWDSVLGTIRFLWPWSQGNFSKEELKNLRELLQLYFHSLPREVQAFSSQFQFECEYAFSNWYLLRGSDQGKIVYGFWPSFNLPDLFFSLRWLTLSTLLHPSPPFSFYPHPNTYTERLTCTYLFISLNTPSYAGSLE